MFGEYSAIEIHGVLIFAVFCRFECNFTLAVAAQSHGIGVMTTVVGARNRRGTFGNGHLGIAVPVERTVNCGTNVGTFLVCAHTKEFHLSEVVVFANKFECEGIVCVVSVIGFVYHTHGLRFYCARSSQEAQNGKD